MGVRFVDANGIDWMIVPGLPADYPDVGEGGADSSLFPGITFRASTGEIRVLPRAAIPRRVQIEFPLPRLGVRSRTHQPEVVRWEELLRHALVWPPI